MAPIVAGRSLRILLLEDSAADAELITTTLGRAGIDHVAERVDARDSFMRALADFEPDVIISDHAVAQLDVRAALRVVRTARPTAAVIVTTGSDGDGDGFVREGAEALVFKNNLRQLPALIDRGLTVRERLARLSPRQVEVLRLVAEGNTTREIAKHLKLSVKTVETHRGEIMKRTEIHDVVGLVRYAVRVGLVPVED